MPTFTRKLSELIDEDFDFGLGPENYPIFDETYRENLNKKILNHYWNYEIGQETESMFRFSLNRKMNEIMPYYNQLYLSTQIEFDPLQTMKYTDSSDSSTNSTTTGNSESDTNGKSRSVNSTTPQVMLSQNEDYASAAVDVNTDTNVTGNSSQTGTGSGTIERTLQGSQGPASELLMRYRATFLNIDMQIIKDLETLFMQIWDNGDEFTHSNWGMGYGFAGLNGIL